MKLEKKMINGKIMVGNPQVGYADYEKVIKHLKGGGK